MSPREQRVYAFLGVLLSMLACLGGWLALPQIQSTLAAANRATATRYVSAAPTATTPPQISQASTAAPIPTPTHGLPTFTPTPTLTRRLPTLTPTPAGPPPNSFIANVQWEASLRLVENPCNGSVATAVDMVFALMEVGVRDNVIADYEAVALHDDEGTYLTTSYLDWPNLSFRFQLTEVVILEIYMTFIGHTELRSQWEYFFPNSCYVTYRDF